MLPEETHVKILKQLDDIEADMYRLYRRAERLRLSLQRQWHAMPSGERWTEQKQRQSEGLSTPDPYDVSRRQSQS